MHQMNLVGKNAQGGERWVCPSCSRDITIYVEPYRRVVNDPGNEFEDHACSKEPFSIKVEPQESEPEIPAFAAFLMIIEFDDED